MIKKLEAHLYNTDKSQDYLDKYDSFFQPLGDKQIVLLEIGVDKGGSLLLWRDYFQKGKIVGIDINDIVIDDATGRITVFQGAQQDVKFLQTVAENTAPDGFDIIIDDASHIGELTNTTFWYLFENHLKPGGLYIIEDWGTGYWGSWPDGEEYKGNNHIAGMVGFVKELVDECAMADITKPGKSKLPFRESKIELMQISFGQVFIKKSSKGL